MARAAASSRALIDHDEIRRWAEERNGKPARIKGTGGDGDIGMIRLDFPGYSGEGSLEEISWDEWFQKFDESNLALLVQDKTARGPKSNFNKLVNRDTLEESQSGRSSSPAPGIGSRSQRTGETISRSDEEGLEAYADTDLYEEADVDDLEDEDLEEDADAEEARPVRVSGVGNSRNSKRQASTSTVRENRSSRGTATARKSAGQARRSRSPKRTAAGGTSSKRTQATGSKRGASSRKRAA
jgi:hypothetical protein